MFLHAHVTFHKTDTHVHASGYTHRCDKSHTCASVYMKTHSCTHTHTYVFVRSYKCLFHMFMHHLSKCNDFSLLQFHFHLHVSHACSHIDSRSVCACAPLHFQIYSKFVHVHTQADRTPHTTHTHWPKHQPSSLPTTVLCQSATTRVDCNMLHFASLSLVSDCSKAGAAYVRGVQEHCGACAKHMVGNDQEDNRHSMNAVIDERTLREIYLAPFEMVVAEAGVEGIMCGYNRVNGTFCTENKWLLQQVIREDQPLV